MTKNTEKTMNAKMTVEVVRNAANLLRKAAMDMEHQAKLMDQTGDLTRASECLNIISNLIPNLRIDLLVTRPIREYERAIRES